MHAQQKGKFGGSRQTNIDMSVAHAGHRIGLMSVRLAIGLVDDRLAEKGSHFIAGPSKHVS